MTLRTARTNRLLAWLGLLAIVLLSIVPTVSQLMAYESHPLAMMGAAGDGAEETDHACHGNHGTGHVEHARPADDHGGMPCHGEKPGEDCWHKCGYCDFLTHAPALRSFEFLAHFATALPPILVPQMLALRAYAAYFPAAQPRGPPPL